MKKVLFLITGGSIHGGEKVDLAFGQLLEEEGYNVDYVAIQKMKVDKIRSRKLRLICLNTILFFRYFLSNHKIILLNHYYLWESILLLMWSKVIFRKKLVFIVFHLLFKCPVNSLSYWSRTRQKELIPLLIGDLIITISRFTKEEIRKLGIPSRKVKIVYPLIGKVNSVERNSSPSRNSIISILFVGTIYPRKGVVILCEAFSKLPWENIRLHLVGNNTLWLDYFKEILPYIQNDKRIVMHGQLSDSDLSALYKSANIFVLPSYWEGFGMVLVEAMRYGLPIISTNVSAIPELVEHKRNGILIEPGDIDALQRALRTLIENPELRKSYSQAAYKRYYELPLWKDEVIKFISYFKDL